mgnify:CR=1 FL=1
MAAVVGAVTAGGRPAGIADDMEGARSRLGVCPQHDVLFDSLTTREHVVFFALLKGGACSWAEAEAEADELLVC